MQHHLRQVPHHRLIRQRDHRTLAVALVWGHRNQARQHQDIGDLPLKIDVGEPRDKVRKGTVGRQLTRRS